LARQLHRLPSRLRLTASLLAFFRRSVVPRGENDIVLRRLFALVALFLLTSVAMADAKTFRYAYRIDPASLDPHALAETFTLSWLGQVYEPSSL
jgi:peptide/nickel transport system substrate-binding protein